MMMMIVSPQQKRRRHRHRQQQRHCSHGHHMTTLFLFLGIFVVWSIDNARLKVDSFQIPMRNVNVGCPTSTENKHYNQSKMACSNNIFRRHRDRPLVKRRSTFLNADADANTDFSTSTSTNPREDKINESRRTSKSNFRQKWWKKIKQRTSSLRLSLLSSAESAATGATSISTIKTMPQQTTTHLLNSTLLQRLRHRNFLLAARRKLVLPITILGLGLSKLPRTAFAMGGAVGGSKPVLPMKRCVPLWISVFIHLRLYV